MDRERLVPSTTKDSTDEGVRGSLIIGLLGLGEAGSAIAADLVSVGASVRGYDPVAPIPVGVISCDSEAEAVRGANLVLSVNSADASVAAAVNSASACGLALVFADLNTSSPERKREVAAALPQSVYFVDVAIMSTVPGKGLSVPMAASGPGAQEYSDILTPMGANVDVVSGGVGAAATRKLLRSVFFKGLAAAVVESLAAARVAGLEKQIRAEIARELASATEDTVTRLEEGSRIHAVRRSHEMEAVVELLGELDTPALVSAASRDWLRMSNSDRSRIDRG